MTRRSATPEGAVLAACEPAPRLSGMILGIDPGIDGAVAILRPDGQLYPYVTPTLPAGKGGRRLYDAAGMVALLRRFPVGLAVIEDVRAAPVSGRVQGAQSMFNFGKGYGLWLGMLAALEIPFQAVAPQTWKAFVLRGTRKDKAAACEFVSRRWPGVSLLPTPRCRVPHDGLADAACLAEWGRIIIGANR